MRTITEHQINPVNDGITIEVMDEPGAGGAHHAYHLGIPGQYDWGVLLFQNGPIAEAGVNGITHEALLAIVADRLRCFQAGPYACAENVFTLALIEEALMWLHKRTRDRMARGVEGTSQP